ncbi:lipocalin-like domain-containing protein [uncultured Paracoccus sp.]|uniref:lipocalin-like domain-containing protein n=1 Tax=uncultured Paracoccus sp. TaxID=189685 RepID=UPI002639E9A6|nr:lipocalin-like domain-containing protein [uncultured Paracoccus sp.]
MTPRGWGVAGVVMAISAGSAAYLVSAARNSEAIQSAPPQGSDWILAAADAAVDGFDRLSGPWELQLPADHATHLAARTEVWQVSAHLEDEQDEPVGVQFQLFRIGLAGPDAPPPTSSWDARELFRGHVVLAAAAGGDIEAEERFGRGMAGLAGYDEGRRELRLDNWSLQFPADLDSDQWTLNTGPGNIRIELNLVAQKDPLLIAGDAAPFRGYAFTRLRATGTVETQAGPQSVSGVAWVEQLWGDLPIPGATPVASDRLQLQLDDGSELSVIRSRRVDGSGVPTVEALVIDTAGATLAFSDDTAHVELGRRWQGEEAAWPVEWRLRLGDLQLDVTPVTDAQEHAFMGRIWSGLVRAQGRRGNKPVAGLGTLQLTGYAN